MAEEANILKILKDKSSSKPEKPTRSPCEKKTESIRETLKKILEQKTETHAKLTQIEKKIDALTTVLKDRLLLTDEERAVLGLLTKKIEKDLKE